MSDWNFNYQEVSELLSKVGKGSSFIYETAVVPTTLSDLESLIQQGRSSYLSIRSRIAGKASTADSEIVPMECFGAYGPVLADILVTERDTISSVRKLTDDGHYTDDRIYILASAMREIIRINSELDGILSEIIESGRATGHDSEISNMDTYLRRQMSNIESLLASA